MTSIPGSVNGVSIEFSENVNRSVDQRVWIF